MRKGQVTTPTSLPNGKSLDDYGKPSMKGKTPKADADLMAAGSIAMGGGITTHKVPEGRKLSLWKISLYRFLKRRGKKATVAIIGDSEVCVKILEEQ